MWIALWRQNVPTCAIFFSENMNYTVPHGNRWPNMATGYLTIGLKEEENRSFNFAYSQLRKIKLKYSYGDRAQA